jgi:hypothetical protein
MTEGCYLFDVLRHITNPQLRLERQHLDKKDFHLIAWNIERFKRLLAEIAKVENGVPDIFGLPGHLGA